MTSFGTMFAAVSKPCGKASKKGFLVHSYHQLNLVHAEAPTILWIEMSLDLYALAGTTALMNPRRALSAGSKQAQLSAAKRLKLRVRCPCRVAVAHIKYLARLVKEQVLH